MVGHAARHGMVGDPEEREGPGAGQWACTPRKQPPIPLPDITPEAPEPPEPAPRELEGDASRPEWWGDPEHPDHPDHRPQYVSKLAQLRADLQDLGAPGLRLTAALAPGPGGPGPGGEGQARGRGPGRVARVRGPGARGPGPGGHGGQGREPGALLRGPSPGLAGVRGC